MTTSEQITAIILHTGWSRHELARRLSVPYSTLSEWANGRIGGPQSPHIRAKLDRMVRKCGAIK